VAQLVDGDVASMPIERYSVELAHEVACLGVQRPDIGVLDFPPARKLLDHQFAVTADLEVERPGIDHIGIDQAPHRIDQCPIFRLVVRDQLAIGTEVEPRDGRIGCESFDQVAAITLARVSERAAVERDFD